MIEPEDLGESCEGDGPEEPKPKKPELQLVIWPDESLKYPVRDFPIKDLGTRLVKNTAGAMIEAMYKHHGIGLAAQQVGVPFAIFVMDPHWHGEGSGKRPQVYLNPRIVDVGKGAIEMPRPGEGCLSFPYGYRNPVRRYDKVELEWYDFRGDVQHKWFEGHDALVVQHEVDHLAGFCFIDRLSPLKKDMALRKARKVRRQYRNGFKAMIREMKNAPRTRDYQIKRQKAFEAGVRAGLEGGNIDESR